MFLASQSQKLLKDELWYSLLPMGQKRCTKLVRKAIGHTECLEKAIWVIFGKCNDQ
jgi:hypothetical protein